MLLNVFSICRTPLHYASAHNHPDVVTLLLENKSNINIQDDEGCTPLIKVAIGHLFWYVLVSLFGFCCCEKTQTKTYSGEEKFIWLPFIHPN